VDLQEVTWGVTELLSGFGNGTTGSRQETMWRDGANSADYFALKVALKVACNSVF
jgi:hypothetical protein